MGVSIKSDTISALRKYGLYANKRLGQNFLIDENVLLKILEAADIKADDTILEIGPGVGALTEKLSQTGARIVAVEIDKKLAPVLSALEKKYENLKIIYDDILSVDLKSIMGDNPFKVVANLPYYITTPIIMHFLENKMNYERLVVMVQQEVAERIVSPPGSKAYGVLSVAVQYRTSANIAFTVHPESFLPPPGVDSAVIVCTKRAVPPVHVSDEQRFFSIVKAAFSQRRKIISNSIKNIGTTAEQTAKWLSISGIDEKRRAETLSLEEFARLENNWEKW